MKNLYKKKEVEFFSLSVHNFMKDLKKDEKEKGNDVIITNSDSNGYCFKIIKIEYDKTI